MKRVIILWTFAFILTAAFLVWQKISGPTYEVRFNTEVAGVPLKGELLRTHSINGDMPVTMNISDPAVTGTVIWRRYPTDHPWERLAMVNAGGQLKAELPRQKMAGKLEYSVEFAKDGQKVVIPPHEAAVARFKGDVPNLVLVFHVSFMILGMLFSTGCGFEALTNGGAIKTLSRVTFVFLLLGGLILGPVVQKYAFDAFWTGWPLGGDWTDNKLAVGAIVWLVAMWATRNAGVGRPSGKWWCVLAMLAIFVIYGIPHSIHGSTLDYETGEHIQVMMTEFWRLLG
ncbi:MAG: hypothetical protein ACTSSQ_07190 [Alphaproteobacteria bacterium]